LGCGIVVVLEAAQQASCVVQLAASVSNIVPKLTHARRHHVTVVDELTDKLLCMVNTAADACGSRRRVLGELWHLAR
jgi:hypothetical protein